jgi:DNA-directed RNA polymerase II subunit RPB2
MNQTGHGGICSPPGGIPSLADFAPEMYQRFFSAHPITWISTHQLESYNAFIFKELPELIHAENPITILKEPLDATNGIYKYKTEIFIGGEADTATSLGLDVGPPILTLDSGTTIRRMFPNDARIRDLTYAATFRADILVRLTFSFPSETDQGVYTTQVKDLSFKNFNLFRIPILIRSKLCATYQAPKALLMEMGEDRNDAGGYFIVDGAEKVLITRQEQAFNSIYVAVKPPTDIKIATYASVICQNPVSKQTRRVALFRLHESGGTEEGAIRISIPFVKGAIPVFALFRALGVISDKEIVRMILPDTSSGLTTAMENTLIPCIHDAYPITSQVQAIEFIRTLTKGFIVEHVLNILHEHLFCHVPDQPLARAYYLAELVRKMIRVEMRLEPNTNRDDIRNQRLLPTGTLLGGLFSE